MTYPIVLIPGFGFKKSIFNEWASFFLDREIILVDYADYWEPGVTLAQFVGQLLGAMPTKANYVGWSLGGSVVLKIAQDHTSRIEKGVLMGSSPQMVKSLEWPFGLPIEKFQNFYKTCEKNPEKGLSFFFAWIAMGHVKPRKLIRRLSQYTLDAQQKTVLLWQLMQLEKHSWVYSLAQNKTPIVQIIGENDVIISSEVIKTCSRLFPAWRGQVVSGGHLCFLEDPKKIADLILAFIP